MAWICPRTIRYRDRARAPSRRYLESHRRSPPLSLLHPQRISNLEHSARHTLLRRTSSWNGVTPETSEAQDARSKKVLDSNSSEDDHTWISITSHSGEIAFILRVLDYQSFSHNAGAVLPGASQGHLPFRPSVPCPVLPNWTTSTHCAAPPVTSIASLAPDCVCSDTNIAGIRTLLYSITSDCPSGAAFPAS